MVRTHSTPFAGTIPVPAVQGPGAGVTMISGRSFAISDGDGNMSPALTQGLFTLDTRVLSLWVLTLNGDITEPLSVDEATPYRATFVARGRPAPNHADADIVVVRRRSFEEGMRERIEIVNHGLTAVELDVRLAVDCDFADLFEVKESRAVQRERDCDVIGSRLRFARAGLAESRYVAVDFEPGTDVSPEGAQWRVTLDARERWSTEVTVKGVLYGKVVGPLGPAEHSDEPAQDARNGDRFALEVASDSDALVETLRRSAADLTALRIRDEAHPDLPLVAAGAPWFMTLFGRDSLLTSWMATIADPELARGVLLTLARLQGSRVDERSAEEPGKIMHEVRYTEAGPRNLDEGERYYGSADATPLFVMLVAELQRWSPDAAVLDRLMPHVDRAMEWIEQYGDRDGDGYVEYERVGDYGLVNQGWKDSWDAIRHADGELARGGIALCEVQAYVYGAYLARAELAASSGDLELHRDCIARAANLYERFNEDFWDDEGGFYALARDGGKRRVAVPASNMGHCLWTGIVRPDRAPAVAARLMSPGMFSGWGIRTLDSGASAYNPVSYHNGSVWPHDNALCALGLARYGFRDEALRVITAQLDVAAEFEGRLPELFAGFDRAEFGMPAVYPSSCSPQAWASAAPLLWLRIMLGLEPDARQHRFWLSPELPDGVEQLRVTGIAIAGRRIGVDVSGDRASVSGTGDLALVPAHRPVFDPIEAARELGVAPGVRRGERP